MKKILATPLISNKEATEKEGALAASLETYLEYLDKGLWKIAGDKTEQPIWSDMSDEERTVVARILLRAGKASPVAAFVARQAMSFEDETRFLIIVAPRGYETVKLLGSAALPMLVPQQARRQRRVASNGNLP